MSIKRIHKTVKNKLIRIVKPRLDKSKGDYIILYINNKNKNKKKKKTQINGKRKKSKWCIRIELN